MSDIVRKLYINLLFGLRWFSLLGSGVKAEYEIPFYRRKAHVIIQQNGAVIVSGADSQNNRVLVPDCIFPLDNENDMYNRVDLAECLDGSYILVLTCGATNVVKHYQVSYDHTTQAVEGVVPHPTCANPLVGVTHASERITSISALSQDTDCKLHSALNVHSIEGTPATGVTYNRVYELDAANCKYVNIPSDNSCQMVVSYNSGPENKPTFPAYTISNGATSLRFIDRDSGASDGPYRQIVDEITAKNSIKCNLILDQNEEHATYFTATSEGGNNASVIIHGNKELRVITDKEPAADSSYQNCLPPYCRVLKSDACNDVPEKCQPVSQIPDAPISSLQSRENGRYEMIMTQTNDTATLINFDVHDGLPNLNPAELLDNFNANDIALFSSGLTVAEVYAEKNITSISTTPTTTTTITAPLSTARSSSRSTTLYNAADTTDVSTTSPTTFYNVAGTTDAHMNDTLANTNDGNSSMSSGTLAAAIIVPLVSAIGLAVLCYVYRVSIVERARSIGQSLRARFGNCSLRDCINIRPMDRSGSVVPLEESDDVRDIETYDLPTHISENLYRFNNPTFCFGTGGSSSDSSPSNSPPANGLGCNQCAHDNRSLGESRSNTSSPTLPGYIKRTPPPSYELVCDNMEEIDLGSRTCESMV